MTALGRIRAILLTVVLGVLACLPASTAVAQGYTKLAAGEDLINRPIYLGLSKSMVLDLPRPANDVLVSNPAIADAVLRTSTRLYLIGVRLGQASVFLFDNAGEQIASFDIFVEADLSGLNRLLAEAIPNGYIRADAINDSVILRGQVASSSDASRAEELARRMVPAFVTSVTTGSSSGTTAGSSATTSQQTFDPTTGPVVVNLLTITSEEQVAVKVTIAEVRREVVKQLGINQITGISGGSGVDDDWGVDLQNPALPFTSGLSFIWENITGDSVEAAIQALEETNMIRLLAEPTLTAVTGETADFLVGGEFPFLVDQGNNEPPTVEFKRFGVQLAFTPVVISRGRISLKVRTEVSELADLIGGIPSLSTRRAETTVELPSGGAFVMAGLLQENSSRTTSGLPGLQRLPIIGSLFSSKDFLSRDTELVMIITPYLVKPTSPDAFARPDDNMFMANDAEAYFLNRLTKVYGADAQAPAGADAAQVGFTFD